MDALEYVKSVLRGVLDSQESVLTIFAIVVVVLKSFSLLTAWLSKRRITAHVNHKERVFYPLTQQSMYLIYTDRGVFSKKDSWAFMAFGSSTTYGEIRVGRTYQFSIYNFRVPLLSRYPNIIKAKEFCELE